MSAEPSLPQKVIAVTAALGQGGVPHAVGGAIALGYYAEPRATADIDLNLFCPSDRPEGALAAVTDLGVRANANQRAAIKRHGQVRLRWGRTPLDLFFATVPFHDRAATRIRWVPFADVVIPVLAVEDLLVCKAVFDRPQDWVDISAVRAAGTPLDAALALAEAAELLTIDDERWRRLARVLADG